MKKFFPLIFMIIVLIVLSATDLSAQCAMCKAAAESGQRNGSEVAEGLNAGILYLMGIPYLLLVGMGILLFRKLNQNRVEESA